MTFSDHFCDIKRERHVACGDNNSKVVEVVTVADVNDENRVGNSLLQIWKLRFGHKA